MIGGAVLGLVLRPKSVEHEAGVLVAERPQVHEVRGHDGLKRPQIEVGGFSTLDITDFHFLGQKQPHKHHQVVTDALLVGPPEDGEAGLGTLLSLSRADENLLMLYNLEFL